MLGRRGFRPRAASHDLPFPADLGEEALGRIAERLGHYAFRLFLRGAIREAEGFAPEEATRYLDAEQAREAADELVQLGLASRGADGLYRLLQGAGSFGGVLEWYVARELRLRFDYEVATGLEFPAAGVGGDLDVVATAEGKLVYLELKSSPPKNLEEAEVRAFFERLEALRPDVALFVMDTALRLADKVIPFLSDEVERRRRAAATPQRLARSVWMLGPHLYAVGAHRDLMGNVSRALAEGLRSLAPSPW
jgi:hypothetical protein